MYIIIINLGNYLFRILLASNDAHHLGIAFLSCYH